MTRLVSSLALLLAIAGCRDERRDQPVRATPPVAPAIELEPARPLGPSIYDLDVTLTTSTGATASLDISRGHPVIISMFYGSCTVACPLLLSEVKQTVDELPPAVRQDVRVLLVSFDASRDTPAALANLVRERKLDDRYTVAAASDDDARALAAVLGFKYRRMADGNYAHGSTILALDREGRPIARVDQLGQRDILSRAIAALPPLTARL
jgi:protein SCO1/2